MTDNGGHSFAEGSEVKENVFELFVSIYPPFRACFRIGVQTFSVCERVDKKEAEWFVERLRSAFKTLEEHQLKQRDETINDLTLQLQVANTNGQFQDEEIKQLKDQLEKKNYALDSYYKLAAEVGPLKSEIQQLKEALKEYNEATDYSKTYQMWSPTKELDKAYNKACNLIELNEPKK